MFLDKIKSYSEFNEAVSYELGERLFERLSAEGYTDTLQKMRNLEKVFAKGSEVNDCHCDGADDYDEEGYASIGEDDNDNDNLDDEDDSDTDTDDE